MEDTTSVDRRTFLKLSGAAVGAAAFGGLSAPTAWAATSNTVLDFDHEVATAWFDRALQLVKATPGFTPPVASRALGYAGVTLYQALVVGMPGYRSLTRTNSAIPHINGAPSGLAWGLVANSAMATILSLLFPNAPLPERKANALLRKSFEDRYRVGLSSTMFSRSVRRGTLMAKSVYTWSTTDGGHQGQLNNFPAYSMPVGPEYWVPTPPNFPPTPLQAYWGENRCFVIGHGEGVVIDPPIPYSEEPGSPFHSAGLEVYEVKANLTADQELIARFWGDGAGTITPPGHSVSTASQVIREKNLSLGEAAEAYAKVGMAVADAFIQCWYAKYKWNLLRPVTYIQRVIDPGWLSLLVTPPFPEHGSGHSTQSGAAAQVLTDLFGDDYAYTDDTHHGVYPARSFSSFLEGAEEAAISRLYGGIHYSWGNDTALAAGRDIGRMVSAMRTRA
ncbi:MAG: vanadium-dependent haloperoxidase [Acidimicrobiia bacterium]